MIRGILYWLFGLLLTFFLVAVFDKREILEKDKLEKLSRR